MTRRPASLHAVPRCGGVPALHGEAWRLPRRYYQGAATSRRPSRLASSSFARRCRRCVRRFAPAGLRTRGRQAGARCGPASPCRGRLRRRRRDLPSSWGTPIAPSPGSSTPAGPSAPDPIATPWRGPRGGNDEGSCIAAFEAQSPGFGARCLRFAPAVARQGRKTRFRLLVRLCRAGFSPAGFRREVSECFLTSHPPLPSLLGAIPHSGQRPGVARRS